MIRWRRLLKGRRTPVLPGAVPALVFLAFLLTFLSTLTPPASQSPSHIGEVGTLQPVGGEQDATESHSETARRRENSKRRAVSAPKPLIIREPVPVNADVSMVGDVEPVGGRCVFQIGGCRLELEFENRTNGWAGNVDLRYELSRSGRPVRSGFISGTPDRIAPMKSKTVTQRIDDVNLEAYELEFCVELFDWFSHQSDDRGDVTGSDACLIKSIQVER